MRILLTQSNYIPWKGYFDLIKSVDKFVIYDDVQFTKNDWRNRNQIKTKQGLQWLSIPVFQKSLNQKIQDTKVSQTNWNIKHWKTLMTNYSKAKSFDRTSGLFSALYEQKLPVFLSEINYVFIKTICDYLDIQTEIVWSRELNLNGNKNERLIDACKKLNANTYLSGPSASDYLDLDLFRQENINVEWANYADYPEYSQLYGKFIHEVSILDLIFNEGINSKKYMKTF
jgi:WbqC-like protein family